MKVHASFLKPWVEEEVVGNPTPLFYHQRTEIDPELQVDEWICKRILAHRVVGDSWEFLTEWEGAEDSPTWEPPGNFVHRYSSEFVKYCRDHRVKFDLVQHLATHEPREVNQVECKFRRWPYVREDYAVRREVFEDILVGLGVPDPPVDAFATEANHLCPFWWGLGGEHEDAFAQSWKGQLL